MSVYSEFFLNSDVDVFEYELFQITHPYFSQQYNIVVNNSNGLRVTLDSQEIDFEYYPCDIKLSNERNDLESEIQVSFNDLGEIFPKEMDRINNDFLQKPLFRYMVYRSDNLLEPMLGPLTLTIDQATFNKDGVVLIISMNTDNKKRIGEYYSIDRFPTLRSSL